ncbi:MAG: Mini-ribonuclease 3 [Lachnospiraceae bacterium]
MDQGLNKTFLRQTEEIFSLREADSRIYSGLPLAFIGDCVFELTIRTLVLSKGSMQVQKLTRRCQEIVRASSQAAMIREIIGDLTEEEQAVIRRGKNSSPSSKAKNASTEDYLWATGYESLIGWLYLENRQDRLLEIIKAGLETSEEGRKLLGM